MRVTPRSLVNVLLFAALVLLLLIFATSPKAAKGQVCTDPPTVSTRSMPANTGAIPPAGDVSVGSNYVWALGQWGVARASLSTPGNPGPWQEFVVGREGGASVGLIPILCDCHQGENTFDLAEGGGASRALMDWQPYAQGGPPPPNDPNGNFSGLPAQLVQAPAANGQPTFGQQINLPARVPLGARIATIWTGSKTFGYIPVLSNGVYVADITSPTGNPSYQNAIQGAAAIGWQGGATAPRLAAGTLPGGSSYLFGTTGEPKLHVATINASTGALAEVLSVPIPANPGQLEVVPIGSKLYVFLAAGLSGAQAFSWDGATLTLETTWTANISRMLYTGGILFAYRNVASNGSSFVDVYGSDWSSPMRSLPHFASSDGAHYWNSGFGAYVNGTTGYVYRELVPDPPGLPTVQAKMRTDAFSVSCGAPPPPTPTPVVTPPPGGNPYASQIEAIWRAGITAGCGGGKFCPDRMMTRQEVAAWIAKALNLPLLQCAGVFNDVPCPPLGARPVQP